MPEVQQSKHDMWRTRLADDAVRRVFDEQPTLEYQQLQAQVETMVVMHSIRRILIWTLVILPIITAVLIAALSLFVLASAPVSPTPPMYY